MTKEVVNSSAAPAPIGPYNQAIKANGFLFLSGQIALNAATGLMENEHIQIETERVMQNIIHILQEAGLGLESVVKTSIFLQDMNDFAAVNEIYGKYMPQPFPARETVQVARLPKDAHVEISVIAVCD
jgi:2-iminobutanoate/2-iminopropanoate deaminase